MSKVKETAKTTITLIIFFAILYGLTYWVKMRPNQISNAVQLRLQTRAMLGPFNSMVLGITFWTLLIISIEDAVISELYAFAILIAFAFPLAMSVIVTILSLIPAINFYWFWASYYLLMIIGVICYIPFLYLYVSTYDGANVSAGNANKSKESQLDFLVECLSLLFLLILLLILVITLIIFVVRNKGSLF